jgi:hypothetical protein
MTVLIRLFWQAERLPGRAFDLPEGEGSAGSGGAGAH